MALTRICCGASALRKGFGQRCQAGFRDGVAGEIRGQPVNALVGNIDNIGVFYAAGLQFKLIGKVTHQQCRRTQIGVEMGVPAILAQRVRRVALKG